MNKQKSVSIQGMRGPGDKFPKNFVKTAILRFTADIERSATEIYDYMELVFHVTESKGIRVHLGWLVDNGFLEKRVKPGVGSYFKWKKSFESFRKIVIFLEDNSIRVRQVEVQNSKFRNFDSMKIKVPRKLQKKLKTKELEFPYPLPMGVELGYQSRLADFDKEIDIARYWYNTEYTESFLNKKTLNYFLNKAYQLFQNDEELEQYYKQHGVKVKKQDFRGITFYIYDDETIVTLLYHSPSLVLHVIDLENRYKRYEKDLYGVHDFIFEMVLKDLMERAFMPHRTPTGIASGFEKVYAKDGRYAGLDMRLVSALENPHDPDAFSMAFDDWPDREFRKSDKNISSVKDKAKPRMMSQRRSAKIRAEFVEGENKQ